MQEGDDAFVWCDSMNPLENFCCVRECSVWARCVWGRVVCVCVQKGQLFHNGRNGRETKLLQYKGHYRTENCTKRASDDIPEPSLPISHPPQPRCFELVVDRPAVQR